MRASPTSLAVFPGISFGEATTAADGHYEFNLHLFSTDSVRMLATARHHFQGQRTFTGLDLSLNPTVDFPLPPSPPNPDPIRISGRVFDAAQASYAPIAAAQVRYAVRSAAESEYAGITQTEPDGTFAIPEDLFRYDIIEVTVSAAGFDSADGQWKVFWLEESNFRVDFALLPVGAARGHDIAGRLSCPGIPTPTPSAHGDLTRAVILLPAERWASTDQGAYFRFSNVPDGSYELQIVSDEADATPCPNVSITVDGHDVELELCPASCSATTPTPTASRVSTADDVLPTPTPSRGRTGNDVPPTPTPTPVRTPPNTPDHGRQLVTGVIYYMAGDTRTPLPFATIHYIVTSLANPASGTVTADEHGHYQFLVTLHDTDSITITADAARFRPRTVRLMGAQVDQLDFDLERLDVESEEQCPSTLALDTSSGPPGAAIELVGRCYWIHSGGQALLYFYLRLGDFPDR